MGDKDEIDPAGLVMSGTQERQEKTLTPEVSIFLGSARQVLQICHS